MKDIVLGMWVKDQALVQRSAPSNVNRKVYSSAPISKPVVLEVIATVTLTLPSAKRKITIQPCTIVFLKVTNCRHYSAAFFVRLATLMLAQITSGVKFWLTPIGVSVEKACLFRKVSKILNSNLALQNINRSDIKYANLHFDETMLRSK